MKIVLAVEGTDGAGKSSLATYVKDLCAEHDRACTLVGRQTGFVSPVVAKLSRLLREETRALAPRADVFVRIAREYQRAHLAAVAPPGVVLLDRFVLTVLSLARIHGYEVDLITRLLQDITARADLFATIFVQCPFEVARSRVSSRNQAGVQVRQRGERLLRRVAEFMEEDFHRGLLTGQQWLVDNSRALENGEEQVASYLLPHLQKT